MKKRVITKSKLPNLDISVSLFKNLVAYLFTEYTTRSFIKKLDILFQSVNLEVYTQDADINPYFTVVRMYVDKVLVDEVIDLNIILDYVTSNPKYKDEIAEVFESIDDIDLDKNEAIFIENEFVDRLNYVKTIKPLATIKSLLSAYEKNEFDSYEDIISQLRLATTTFNKELVVRNTNSLTVPDLDFGDSHAFKSNIHKIHKSLKNEKRFIKTGVQRLNVLFGGGYQPGRVYVYLGITGGFKSAILLNSIYWAAKYNPDVTCNDNSRRPLALYITMENDLDESIERTFAYVGATDDKGDVHENFEQAFQRLEQELSKDTHWGIALKFRPKYSIIPADIDSMISEIEADGIYEVKILVHDYLKRINPDVLTGDRRVDLGEVVNDFSMLAKRRKIAIVTANQMNSSAYKKLEEGNNLDKAKDLNVSAISESQLIAENADSVIAINKEYLISNESHFLTFKDLKQRSRKKNITKEDSYFAHPFEPDNAMRLIEDIHMKKSVSRKLISDELSTYDPNKNIIEEDIIISEVVTDDTIFKKKSSKTVSPFEDEFIIEVSDEE